MKYLVLLFSLFLISCSHKVYKMDVEQQKINQISSETTKACVGRCELDQCWYEKMNFIVCNVKFSFVADFHKGNMLADASDRLAVDQLNVGFCGRDTAGSSLARAFIGGLVFGALGGGAGSSAGGGNTIVRVAENQKLVDEACSSVPSAF